MIDNKQVNIWRGTDPPPTIYHVWIFEDRILKLFNGEDWIVFIDNGEILNQLGLLDKRVTDLETELSDISDSTINDKPIKDNPILTGKDIILDDTGTFVKNTSLSDNILKLDNLLTTLIIQ